MAKPLQVLEKITNTIRQLEETLKYYDVECRLYGDGSGDITVSKFHCGEASIYWETEWKNLNEIEEVLDSINWEVDIAKLTRKWK